MKRKMGCPGYEDAWNIPKPDSSKIKAFMRDRKQARNITHYLSMADTLESAILRGSESFAAVQLKYCTDTDFFSGCACTMPVTGPITEILLEGIEMCESIMEACANASLQTQEACYNHTNEITTVHLKALNASYAHEFNMMTKKHELQMDVIEAKTN